MSFIVKRQNCILKYNITDCRAITHCPAVSPSDSFSASPLKVHQNLRGRLCSPLGKEMRIFYFDGWT